MTCQISKTVETHLCTGCGGCAGLFPNDVTMIERPKEGRRPAVLNKNTHDLDAICAASGIDYGQLDLETQEEQDWGPVLATYIGHAADPAVRFKASSGGAISAIMQHMIEVQDVDGFLNIGQSSQNAKFNEARLTRTKDDILNSAGSRYAQASPLERLWEVGSGQTVGFVGKPCDVATMQKIRQARPEMRKRVPLTISLLCAGPANGEGVSALLSKLDVAQNAAVNTLRFRGEGWPGTMQATYTKSCGTTETSRELSYAEGWGNVLQQHRLWPCRICSDHVGFFADISVGDPWHMAPEGNTAEGESLIVARTPYGKAIIEDAILCGVLVAEEVGNDALPKAQPNLLKARANAYGRRLTMRLMGLSVPHDKNDGLFGCWMRSLTLREKVSSILGTAKRIIRQKIYRPSRISAQPTRTKAAHD